MRFNMLLENDRAARQERARVAEVRRRYELLTQQEREVMKLVVSGLLNKQIAGELRNSEVTIKIHRGGSGYLSGRSRPVIPYQNIIEPSHPMCYSTESKRCEFDSEAITPSSSSLASPHNNVKRGRNHALPNREPIRW
jgi:DNA-binding CsgD family transcriptional regulator